MHDNWYSTNLSGFEECVLSLYLDGRQLEQTQEERLLGLDIDPSLSWSSHVDNLRKKLLRRVAVLARIKKILPVIILVNASIKPVLEYYASVWGSCNAGLLNDIFKVEKICARIILDAPFQSRTLPLFLEPGWLPINQICYEISLFLLKTNKQTNKQNRKSWMDVHLITSLRNSYLCSIASHIAQGLGCLIVFLFHVTIA